jgi:membrane fusion protein (multidrug efflux system)
MKKSLLFSAAVAAAALASCGTSESAQGDAAQLLAQRDSLETMRSQIDAALRDVNERLTALDTTAQWSNVTLYGAASGAFEHGFNVYGTVRSDQSVSLYPESAGRIAKVNVRAGQQIAAGTVVVELDNQVMRSSLAEVKTQLELAQTLYDKQKRLWDQGVGSEVQYLQAKTQFESLKKRLSAVEAQVGMTQIRAPFSGTVDEVFVREGEYAAPGMAAARLISNGGLRLEMDIPETYLTRIKTGQKVSMDFNSVGIKSEGSISSVGGFISPDSRTFRVTVNLPANSMYKPNMLASVYVRDYQADSALYLPNRLILQDRKGSNYTYVYVAKSGVELGTVERRDLTLGVVGGETTEIKGGILAGDRVIDRGIRSVQPKQTVKAITE